MPPTELRSHESRRRCTSLAGIPAGIPVSCQPATGGTAVANASGVKPFRYKNRSNDRSSATRPFADPTVSREHSRTKNPTTQPR